MNHVAIDLASRKSQICVRSPGGQVVMESKSETKALKSFFRELERSRVVLETSSEAFKVADYAISAGHEVNVVPATLAPSLGGVDSLVCIPVLTSHAMIPAEQRAKSGITEQMIRLSVGIENADDLIADLEQALAGVRSSHQQVQVG